MRHVLCAAFAAAICLALAQANAQPQPSTRGAADQVRSFPPPSPNVRFRARSAGERSASVRRLLAAQQRTRAPGAAAATAGAHIPLASTFQLTARTPYVEGQGWMNVVYATSVEAQPEPSGWISMLSGLPNALTIGVRSQGAARVLVECTVWDQPQQQFNAALFGDANVTSWTDTTTSHNNVISFLTPPLMRSPHMIYLRISPVDQSKSWWVLGCEVTRLAN
jgi:hypothetical protein